MNFGLPAESLSLITNCLAGFPDIQKICIFGSRAIGTHRYNSDIDIAVWLSENTKLTIAQIASDLDQLSTPYLFDVIDFNQIKSVQLKAHIDQFGKTLQLRT